MKISNFNYIMKGITLTLCGLLIAFFPGVISWIFYIIGGIIIAASIISFLASLGDDTGFMFVSAIIGVAAGLFIIYLFFLSLLFLKLLPDKNTGIRN